MIKTPIVRINNEHDMELALNRLMKGEMFITVHKNHGMHNAYTNMIIEHLREKEKELLEKMKKNQSESSLKSNDDSSTSS